MREALRLLGLLTFAGFAIGLQLVAGMAAALVAAQGVDADVLAIVLHQLAFIHVQHEGSGEAELLHGPVRNKPDVHLIAMGSKEGERGSRVRGQVLAESQLELT